MSWSYFNWCKFCIHHRRLDVCHFGIKWDKTVASMSPPVADVPPNFIKCMDWFKCYLGGGDTDGQIDWWSHKLHFPFQGKQAKVWWMRYENPSLMFPPQRFALSSVCWYNALCVQLAILGVDYRSSMLAFSQLVFGRVCMCGQAGSRG
jgi:hypothetical protein